jgi:uncharacterized membrane protein (DUF106 family)
VVDIIYFELVAISIIDVVVSILLQRAIANTEKTYHLQNKMQRHMKEHKELMDRKASAEELAAKQKEITQTMSDTMMHQFRATPVLFLVSIALYFFILPTLFPTTNINTFPILGFKYPSFQDNYFFIGVTFVIGFVVQIALSRYDKKRFDLKYGVTAGQPQANPQRKEQEAK